MCQIGKKQECVFCDCCNEWLHKNCFLLETNVFEKLGNSNEVYVGILHVLLELS